MVGNAFNNKSDVRDAINTEKKSRERFSHCNQQKADKMRRFQHDSEHSSDTTSIYAAVTNGIKNSPFTKRDVELTVEMLGRSKYAIQGKTVRTQPDAVDADQQMVELPLTLTH